MKKLLLILLLSFSFIVSSYADSDSCINAYDNEFYENIVIECTTPANAGDMVSKIFWDGHILAVRELRKIIR